MKCDNILCGYEAEFLNVKTNQRKCKNCLEKHIDKNSPIWVKMEDDDQTLEFSKLEVKNKYSIVFSGGKWFVYCNDEASFSLSSESQKQAQDFCDSMNESYRKGLEDALIELKYFSINIRRKHGIIW